MLKETPKLPLIGGVIAAIGASVCCVGLLVLLMLGIGGSWVSGLTAFVPYRPIFITIVAILLAWAGRQLYRPIEQCPEGSICAIPTARLRYRQFFWSVLLVAMVLVTSPDWVPFFA